MNKVTIIPLTDRYLNQAINLVYSIFPDEDEPISIELFASIHKIRLKEFVNHLDTEIKSLKYFIATDNHDRVIGIIGLYTTNEDYEDTYWVGWYAVDLNERGKGIGRALLEHVIKIAKKSGKTNLCLYTSTDPDEATAQILYEKNGFEITKRVKKEDYDLLYRRKLL